MPRDLLYEESAISSRVKAESVMYTVFLVVAIICFAIAGITAFFATATIRSILTNDELSSTTRVLAVLRWVFTIVLLVGLGVVFWFIKKRFNVSYDYTFVEDELRITKVFNGKGRKYLTTIGADQILKLGWCDKNSYQDTLRGLQGKKPKLLTPNKVPAEDKEFIYVFVTGSLEKTLYVLECRRELLEYLVRAAGVNKLERE